MMDMAGDGMAVARGMAVVRGMADGIRKKVDEYKAHLPGNGILISVVPDRKVRMSMPVRRVNNL